MSFCYKKIFGVLTRLRVTTPNIIEPFTFDTLTNKGLKMRHRKGEDNRRIEGKSDGHPAV